MPKTEACRGIPIDAEFALMAADRETWNNLAKADQ
jgi:hypothetical protein